jgi:hypothetical protein
MGKLCRGDVLLTMQYDYNPFTTTFLVKDPERIHAALRTLPSWPRRVLSTTTRLRRIICFIQHHKECEQCVK